MLFLFGGLLRRKGLPLDAFAVISWSAKSVEKIYPINQKDVVVYFFFLL